MKNSICLATSLLLANVVWSKEVPSEQWLEAMRTTMPTVLCDSAQYFRQCFDVTAQECEETAASSTRVCINDVEHLIPEMMRLPADGNAWGTRIGQCAGTAYEAALRDKRISNPKCNNPASWAAQ